MSLIIREQLIAAQLQGIGRRGALAAGCSTAGPMDEIAFRWNAHLLQSDVACGQIEVFQGGLKAQFTKATTFSIAGADLNTSINGKRIANWCMHHAREGDEIHMPYASKGLRAYLAVADGFLVDDPNTVVRLQLGGLHGRILAEGDNIPYRPRLLSPLRGVRWSQLPDYDAPSLTLHLIPGYQFEHFDDDAVEQLLHSVFRVSNRNDRMGICLHEAPIPYEGPRFPSEGIAFGAVQVPSDGNPIILLRDGQSIGGYPKIGSLFSLDCALISQQKPGSEVRFNLISAQKALRIRKQIINAIRTY